MDKNNRPTISQPTEGSYEGKPTLSIPLSSGKPFTFGIEKAAAIVRWFEAIKEWSTKNPPKGKLADKVATMTEAEKAELLALLAK